MKPSYDPHIHHRRSIRLKGYDYSQSGFYFVTLVTYQRQCLFGEITGDLMHLSNEGELVGRVWLELPRHFPHISMGEFVIMPNHLHGIIIIQDGESSAQRQGEASTDTNPSIPHTQEGACFDPTGTAPGSLAAIIQNFKSVSTRKINQARCIRGLPVWQRNYYEHIVRDEAEFQRIATYILNNPLMWNEDQENPHNTVGAKHPHR
jgi:REP element-mobilizing transposase RayT